MSCCLFTRKGEKQGEKKKDIINKRREKNPSPHPQMNRGRRRTPPSPHHPKKKHTMYKGRGGVRGACMRAEGGGKKRGGSFAIRLRGLKEKKKGGSSFVGRQKRRG